MTSAGKELNLNLDDDSEDPSVVDEEEGSDDEVSNVDVRGVEVWRGHVCISTYRRPLHTSGTNLLTPLMFFALQNVTETISERLWGLTEMLPDPVWSALHKSRAWSVWFVRRAGWVVGVSVAMMFLPIITEHQRLELEEMQNMQKRQVSVTY